MSHFASPKHGAVRGMKIILVASAVFLTACNKNKYSFGVRHDQERTSFGKVAQKKFKRDKTFTFYIYDYPEVRYAEKTFMRKLKRRKLSNK